MIDVNSYVSFGTLRFGESSQDDCVASYGAPVETRKNHEGLEEFHYEGFVIRFDRDTNLVRECTLLPTTPAKVGGIDLTWDKSFLKRACEHDGDAKDVYGFIVLRNLGIAVTGIHDGDESQLAVTAFSKGDFDDLLSEGATFETSMIE